MPVGNVAAVVDGLAADQSMIAVLRNDPARLAQHFGLGTDARAGLVAADRFFAPPPAGAVRAAGLPNLIATLPTADTGAAAPILPVVDASILLPGPDGGLHIVSTTPPSVSAAAEPTPISTSTPPSVATPSSTASTPTPTSRPPISPLPPPLSTSTATTPARSAGTTDAAPPMPSPLTGLATPSPFTGPTTGTRPQLHASAQPPQVNCGTAIVAITAATSLTAQTALVAIAALARRRK